MTSGGGEIRTHDTLSDVLVFKTSAIDHSATPPLVIQIIRTHVFLQKQYTFSIFLKMSEKALRMLHVFASSLYRNYTPSIYSTTSSTVTLYLRAIKKMQMMSKIPNVLTTRRIVNHHLCESCADRHKAIPFQTSVQITMQARTSGCATSQSCIA